MQRAIEGELWAHVAIGGEDVISHALHREREKGPPGGRVLPTKGEIGREIQRQWVFVTTGGGNIDIDLSKHQVDTCGK